MTKGTFYNKGDAAGYWAWLDRQEPAVGRLAARYRPWEIYHLAGRDFLVKVVGYDASDEIELLHVQYLNNPHQPTGVITVTDGQLELWGVGDLDTLPAAKEAA